MSRLQQVLPAIRCEGPVQKARVKHRGTGKGGQEAWQRKLAVSAIHKWAVEWERHKGCAGGK